MAKAKQDKATSKTPLLDFMSMNGQDKTRQGNKQNPITWLHEHKWPRQNKKNQQAKPHYLTSWACLPFLPMPTAELVSNFRAARLAQQNLDEETLLLVVCDQHLLCVGWNWGFVPDGRKLKLVLLWDIQCVNAPHHEALTQSVNPNITKPTNHPLFNLFIISKNHFIILCCLAKLCQPV